MDSLETLGSRYEYVWACGANNPVEQPHSKQVKDRGSNPFQMLYAWCHAATEMEGAIIQAAETTLADDALLTPWASERVADELERTRAVQLPREVIINPAEEVSATEEVEPNVFVRYDVNLEKRTCGCKQWQHCGIACKHALKCGWSIKISWMNVSKRMNT